MSTEKDLILRLAREAGIGDPDLGSHDWIVTDYGDATESVQNFAALVAEECAKIVDEESQNMAYGLASAAAIRTKFGVKP